MHMVEMIDDCCDALRLSLSLSINTHNGVGEILQQRADNCKLILFLMRKLVRQTCMNAFSAIRPLMI